MSGCGTQSTRSAVTGNHGAVTFTGSVHGGQQPVTFSTIQLYSVGLTADGSASKPLLTATVQTDASGNFGISGLYTCPSDTTLVYLVAKGGNPGMATGTRNNQITMMAALGPCGALASATNIWVDELTTIGSLSPLARYMSGYAGLGSAPSDAYALADAFDLVSEFTDTSIGSVPGPDLPGGFYASQTEINTLGDILAPCINSAGGVAGDGSPCGNLFSLTTPSGGVAPTDTIGAALQILKNPTNNLQALLALVPASPPYLPILAGTPATIAPAILPIAQVPVISLPSGVYTGAQTVTLTDATYGSTIYYTTAASPTASSYVAYTPGTAIPITLAGKLSAYAAAAGYITSPTVSASYSFSSPVVPTLSFTPNMRTFTNSIFVSIASSVSGTQIYYTVDGSQPSPLTSTLFTSAFQVTGTTTINAIGVTAQYPNTAVTSTTFTVNTGLQPQTITTVAGTYDPGYGGDGGQAANASLTLPNAVAFDKSGNMYIADTNNNVVRKVDKYTGIISTFAGVFTQAANGSFCGDNGPATSACLNGPAGLAFDSIGNLYIADAGNSAVRIVRVNGIISTFAGNGNVDYDRGGKGGFSSLVTPTSLAIDGNNNLYVADAYNSEIFKITSAGTLSLFTAQFYTTSGLITSEGQFPYLKTLAVDASGNVYAAVGHVVYRMDPVNATPTVVAGNGQDRFTGDGGFALSASFYNPTGLAIDASGNLFISDPAAGVVREVAPSGTITRIAGGGADVSDDGAATDAALYGPTGLALDANRNLYIAVAYGNIIRKVSAGPPPSTTAPPVATPVEGDYVKASLSVTLTSATPNAAIYYTTDGSTPTPQSTLYNGPVSISDLTYLQAYATSAGILDSGLSIGDYLVTLHPTGVPTFSPGSGTYFGAQMVTITSSTPGAAIYYTMDGSTPTSSSQLYTGPVNVPMTGQLNAIATLAGNHDSRPGTANYTINAAPPVFSVSSGNYFETQTVSITSATAGAQIYYTTDQSTPTSASNLYTGPLTIAKTTYLQAVAIPTNTLANSPSVSAYYLLTPHLPTFSPAPGQYVSVPNVAITSATSGATVYYTTDGSYPTPNSGTTSLYTTPIPINITQTLTAIAVLSPLDNSGASTGTYFITPAPPVASVPAGTYTKRQTISLSSATPKANIYYTLDGTTPTSKSTLYTAPFTLLESRNLQAIASLTGLSDTSPVSTSYIITGSISTVAGTGVAGYTGDGAQAALARLSHPRNVAVDSTGVLYIADAGKVRKLTPGGVISTFGPAVNAYPNLSAMTVDTANNLYITDYTGKIAKVNPAGAVSTLYDSTTLPSSSTRLTGIDSIAVNSSGSVYFSSVNGTSGQGASCVAQVVALADLSTVTGKGCATGGYYTNDGTGIGDLQVILSGGLPLAISPTNSLYVSDIETILKVGPQTLTSITYDFSQAGSAPTTTDGVLASKSLFQAPIGGMAFDAAGNLYFTAGGSVRKITTDGVLVTVAGPPPAATVSQLFAGTQANVGFNGDGGNAVGALFNNPGGLALDNAGNLYVADTNNNRIRKIVLP